MTYECQISQRSDKFDELNNVMYVTDIFQPYLIVFMPGRSARHVPGWNSRFGVQVCKELLLLPLQERLMSEDNINCLLTLILIYLMCRSSFPSTTSLDG